MDIKTILNNKIKPDLTNYTDEQLIGLLKELDVDTSNLQDRTQISNQIFKLWADNPYGENMDCPICLETITNSNHLVTSCAHYFHSNCLIKYICKSVKNNLNVIKCPQCRNLIQNLDEINIQPNNLSGSNVNLNSSSSSNSNNPSPINIFDYPSHQEMFFPPTGLFINNYGGFGLESEPTNVEEEFEESFSFPINLHTGLWTNLDTNMLDNIIPHIFVGIGDPTNSPDLPNSPNTSTSTSISTSISSESSDESDGSDKSDETNV